MWLDPRYVCLKESDFVAAPMGFIDKVAVGIFAGLIAAMVSYVI
ncbi:MAG: hypothetical protein ACTS9Y_00615 [Methylophilus sp.]